MSIETVFSKEFVDAATLAYTGGVKAGPFAGMCTSTALALTYGGEGEHRISILLSELACILTSVCPPSTSVLCGSCASLKWTVRLRSNDEGFCSHYILRHFRHASHGIQ